MNKAKKKRTEFHILMRGGVPNFRLRGGDPSSRLQIFSKQISGILIFIY